MVKKMNSRMTLRPGTPFLDREYARERDTTRFTQVPMAVINTEFCRDLRNSRAFSR
ncbi:hypothetical protein D3C76_1658350 [compost metagenome]